MGQRALRVICLVALLVASAPACESDYPIWIPRSPRADALYRFRRGNRIGYIDQQGKVVIPPTIRWYGFNTGDEFHDGLLHVGAAEPVYVNMTGKKISYKNLYSAWDFTEGLAAAKKQEGGFWGYIDTKGDFAISPRFASGPDDYVWAFSDGLALIKTNARFGFIDHSGEFVIPPTLLDADSFHEGYARVVAEGPCVYASGIPTCPDVRTPGLSRKEQQSSGDKLPNCKVTFIDKSGRVISDKRYDDANYFSEGLAPVRVGGKWGYIDRTGELVIGARFDRAEPFSGGVGLVMENGLYGFIDKGGIYVIPPRFEWAEGFAEGYAVVGIDGYNGPVWYIDHRGNPVFDRKFAAASSFFKGLAHVKLLSGTEGDRKEHFEYLNRDGRTVFAYTP